MEPVKFIFDSGSSLEIGKDVSEKVIEDTNIKMGSGDLGRMPVTFFHPTSPEDLKQLEQVWDDISEEEVQVESRLFTYGLWDLEKETVDEENNEYQHSVLVTEKVDETLVGYIERNWREHRDEYAYGMKMINLLSHIFITLNKAYKQGFSSSVPNMFVQNGTVRYVFLKKAFTTAEFRVAMKNVVVKLVNEAYNGSADARILNPDLNMLCRELLLNGGDNQVFNWFVENPFPLAHPNGVLAYLIANLPNVEHMMVDGKTPISEDRVEFSREMKAVLREHYVYWEDDVYIYYNPDKDWIDVVIRHTKKRQAADRDYRPSREIKERGFPYNDPLQFITISRNIGGHQGDTTEKSYPESIRKLNSSGLIGYLNKIYPGIFTAFFLAMARMDSSKIKIVRHVIPPCAFGTNKRTRVR